MMNNAKGSLVLYLEGLRPSIIPPWLGAPVGVGVAAAFTVVDMMTDSLGSVSFSVGRNQGGVKRCNRELQPVSFRSGLLVCRDVHELVRR